ncbi:MAG: hypothetical protein U0930_11445 [Pirellulales bacterium]
MKVVKKKMLGTIHSRLMLNIEFLLLTVLLMTGYGCSPARPKATTGTLPDGVTWVTSDDGKLALRLSISSSSVQTNKKIQVSAEIRNNSKQQITVLRPFGDSYAAKASGMKIWDGQRQIRYTGPMLSYVIGSYSFAILKPAETVEDKLELTIDSFSGIQSPGTYTLRYDYSYDGYWDATASVGNSDIKDAWRGTISSREAQVVME